MTRRVTRPGVDTEKLGLLTAERRQSEQVSLVCPKEGDGNSLPHTTQLAILFVLQNYCIPKR
jgi:hypothetical protein